MLWEAPKIWEGGEVWILGGGSSLTEQFNIDKNVVNAVVKNNLNPGAYSPYMSAIHKKHVIGVNCSFYFGNWVDVLFFGDNSFFLGHKDNITKFRGIKVSCHDTVIRHTSCGVKFMARDRFKLGISKNPNTVCWNYNSGAAAISLAVHLGAKRIVLVGFDMKVENNQPHWHNIYNSIEAATLKAKLPPFHKHLEGFPQIAKDAKEMGIEIINASPNSAITVFPKCDVKDLL